MSEEDDMYPGANAEALERQKAAKDAIEKTQRGEGFGQRLGEMSAEEIARLPGFPAHLHGAMSPDMLPVKHQDVQAIRDSIAALRKEVAQLWLKVDHLRGQDMAHETHLAIELRGRVTALESGYEAMAAHVTGSLKQITSDIADLKRSVVQQPPVEFVRRMGLMESDICRHENRIDRCTVIEQKLAERIEALEQQSGLYIHDLCRHEERLDRAEEVTGRVGSLKALLDSQGADIEALEKHIQGDRSSDLDISRRLAVLEHERRQTRAEGETLRARAQDRLACLAAETLQTMLSSGIGKPEEVAARAVRAAKELIRLVEEQEAREESPP